MFVSHRFACVYPRYMTTSQLSELSELERILYKIDEAEIELRSIEKDLLLYKAVGGDNYNQRCYG